MDDGFRVVFDYRGAGNSKCTVDHRDGLRGAQGDGNTICRSGDLRCLEADGNINKSTKMDATVNPIHEKNSTGTQNREEGKGLETKGRSAQLINR